MQLLFAQPLHLHLDESLFQPRELLALELQLAVGASVANLLDAALDRLV